MSFLFFGSDRVFKDLQSFQITRISSIQDLLQNPGAEMLLIEGLANGGEDLLAEAKRQNIPQIFLFSKTASRNPHQYHPAQVITSLDSVLQWINTKQGSSQSSSWFGLPNFMNINNYSPNNYKYSSQQQRPTHHHVSYQQHPHHGAVYQSNPSPKKTGGITTYSGSSQKGSEKQTTPHATKGRVLDIDDKLKKRGETGKEHDQKKEADKKFPQAPIQANKEAPITEKPADLTKKCVILTNVEPPNMDGFHFIEKEGYEAYLCEYFKNPKMYQGLIISPANMGGIESVKNLLQTARHANPSIPVFYCSSEEPPESLSEYNLHHIRKVVEISNFFSGQPASSMVKTAPQSILCVHQPPEIVERLKKHFKKPIQNETLSEKITKMVESGSVSLLILPRSFGVKLLANQGLELLTSLRTQSRNMVPIYFIDPLNYKNDEEVAEIESFDFVRVLGSVDEIFASTKREIRVVERVKQVYVSKTETSYKPDVDATKNRNLNLPSAWYIFDFKKERFLEKVAQRYSVQEMSPCGAWEAIRKYPLSLPKVVIIDISGSECISFASTLLEVVSDFRNKTQFILLSHSIPEDLKKIWGEKGGIWVDNSNDALRDFL